jgi:hypothetical protein
MCPLVGHRSVRSTGELVVFILSWSALIGLEDDDVAGGRPDADNGLERLIANSIGGMADLDDHPTSLVFRG